MYVNIREWEGGKEGRGSEEWREGEGGGDGKIYKYIYILVFIFLKQGWMFVERG